MSRTLLRLGVTALATAAVSAVALPSPAMAGSMFFSKSSGTFLSVDWVEAGELPAAANAPGNGHIGFLHVEQAGRDQGNAFGVVYDLQCPDGAPIVLPDGGGPHSEPELPADPDACQIVLVREMKGRGMTFTMDRKFNTAKLSGVLSVGEHGTPAPGQPPVSITVTGVGEPESFVDTSRYSNEYGTGSFRYASTSRSGIVAPGSRIGPMVFDDEAGESSSARLGSFKTVSRNRTP